jgi:hypothetical protein
MLWPAGPAAWAWLGLTGFKRELAGWPELASGQIWDHGHRKNREGFLFYKLFNKLKFKFEHRTTFICKIKTLINTKENLCSTMNASNMFI